MKNEKFKSIEKTLLDKRKSVKVTIEQLKENYRGKKDVIIEDPKNSNDLADESSACMEKEKTFLLMARELKYLNQIDRSLIAISEGTYGKCKICNKNISMERLKAVPTTTTCIVCKRLLNEK